MITHYSDIVLDLDTEVPRAEVWAKQDDLGSRTIRATFQDNGSAVSLSGIDHAELRVLRPDGAMVVSEATVDGDTVTAVLPENALAVSGRGYGDIRLLDSSDNCISAARFLLHIDAAAVSNEQVAQTSDFRALFQCIENEISDLFTALGGLSFKKLTKAEYEALETKSDTTLYFVTDGSKVRLYLGELPAGGGGAVTAGLGFIHMNGVTTAPAGATEQEVV